jgi:hypothetical protein
VATLFYTTPTDTGGIAVTCDQCWQSVSSPDPWAAAAEITHHCCQPAAAIAYADRGLALDGDQPALHLLAGRWVASCPTCGYQLATATTQARCQGRAARTTCPVCREDT